MLIFKTRNFSHKPMINSKEDKLSKIMKQNSQLQNKKE